MGEETQRPSTIEPTAEQNAEVIRTQQQRGDRAFRTNQQMMDMQEINPLLALLMILFLGEDFQTAFTQQLQDRVQDYTNNPSDYGTIRRRVPSGDGAGGSTRFEETSEFPSDVTFTRAYQEDGGLNRIYEGVDAQGNEVTIIKARDTSREGTRSWANNNPGNLRYSGWQDEYGAIGQDKDGFAIFKSVEDGMSAQTRLLQSGSYKNLTLREAVYRYAPPSENNSEAYVRQIAERTGIATNRVLNTLDQTELRALTEAMISHEGWREARVMIAGTSGVPGSDARTASEYSGNGRDGLFVAKPLDSVITSNFGPRSIGMHRGIDLRTSSLDPNGNVPLYARNDMVITDISSNAGGYGHRVSAAIGQDDKGRVITVQFAHLDELPRHLRVGQTLRAGEYIATTGTSGRTFGPHLDFEVRVGAQVVDPEKAFETDLSDSRNGDRLIADARNVLGNKANSGTYNARIAPALARGNVMAAVEDLGRRESATMTAFNSGGTVEQDPQQPTPLTTSFGNGDGTDEVARAATVAQNDPNAPAGSPALASLMT